MRAYGLDGLPITGESLLEQMIAASAVLADGEGRQVALDELVIDGDPVLVSTVFVPWDLDDRAEEHTPVLFETMVGAGPFDGRCLRYTSRQDAEAGHAAVLAELRAGGAALDSTQAPDVMPEPREP